MLGARKTREQRAVDRGSRHRQEGKQHEEAQAGHLMGQSQYRHSTKDFLLADAVPHKLLPR